LTGRRANQTALRDREMRTVARRARPRPRILATATAHTNPTRARSADYGAAERAPTVDGALLPRSMWRRVDSVCVGEIVANGIRLAFDERGAGESVLLIGGTGMPGYARDLVGFDTNAFVEAGYRVMTFDSRQWVSFNTRFRGPTEADPRTRCELVSTSCSLLAGRSRCIAPMRRDSRGRWRPRPRR
jgi:hypothetical protein